VESVVEPLEGNKVKLSVTVESGEFESAIDRAWKVIAKEVKVPGFRAGKVPRKVLESRIEPGYARSEALQQALPDYYVQAVREHSVDVIAQPKIDITAGEDEGDVSFDAVVEVRPEITLDGYQDLTIEIPSPHPSDDDIADQLDRIRGQYGEIVAVERAADTGDYVSIDITGSDEDGEPIDGLTADDYLYEVGAGTVVPELDAELVGMEAGEVATFDADHPDPDEDTQVHFEVEVKEVKERLLPDLDDDWVAEATEFETVDQLRDDVITRSTASRRAQAAAALQSRLGDKLAELVTEEIPDALIGAEMRARLDDMIHRLSHQGITLEQYLSFTGTEPAKFTEDLRETATASTKVDLALRAIATAEDLAPSDEEFEQELEQLAAGNDIDVEALREQLDRNDQLVPIRSDLASRNALRWLTDHVNVVDESGLPVKREDLESPDLEDETGDEHDHDHSDHDHEHD